MPDPMEPSAVSPSPSRTESRLALAVFLLCLGFHFLGVGVGWDSRNLPGVEFRQAQTALSAHWIKAENNFSLAYPTPVLGKPWSIPMEFPLYQWTVVVTGKLTGLGITKAGRAVSIACFYLMLPALYLLLARWRIAAGRRWLVLAVVVTCPLYVFYTRGIFIETMALMFSLWFWAAFERAVTARSRVWLAIAVLSGMGAGLVKVTTFMLYLLPAGVWALSRLWAARKGSWRNELVWMTGALALPFAATLWWLHFSDVTKALNPMAGFLTSANLVDFNFGTHATRFSAGMWAMKWRIVSEELTSMPVMGLCALLGVLAGRKRWREIAACVALFGSVLFIFPVLYALHDYYYMANTLLLLLAMGLALVALAESAAPRWVAGLAVVIVLGGQIAHYAGRYYPVQSAISLGGNGLTQSLRGLTQPNDVIIILGQDWNSMTPFYAQRRALMLREDAMRHREIVDAACTNLADENIGALVVAGAAEGREWLVEWAATRGLARKPLYFWRDVAVFLPEAHQTTHLQLLKERVFEEVKLAPGVDLPRESLAGNWHELAGLPETERKLFFTMQPAPVRFFCAFGPALDGSDGQIWFGAHPVTRLVFSLPAGHHRLRSMVRFSPDAYRQDLPDDKATDGVEVTLTALEPGSMRRVLDTRIVDPRNRPEHRGSVVLEISFDLPAAGEVELFFGPGPAGRDTRDWIALGPLVIE